MICLERFDWMFVGFLDVSLILLTYIHYMSWTFWLNVCWTSWSVFRASDILPWYVLNVFNSMFVRFLELSLILLTYFHDMSWTFWLNICYGNCLTSLQKRQQLMSLKFAFLEIVSLSALEAGSVGLELPLLAAPLLVSLYTGWCLSG